MNSELREKLISMTDAESNAKEALTEGHYDGYPKALEALHILHAEDFLRIVNEHGWPGESLVGIDGAWSQMSRILRKQTNGENHSGSKHWLMPYSRIKMKLKWLAVARPKILANINV